MMSTVTQRKSHGTLGNERLFPMALEGDEAAVAILGDRGNVVTPEGKLRKTRTSKYRDAHGMIHELIETVENGKMIERTVDGVVISGNIVQF